MASITLNQEHSVQIQDNTSLLAFLEQQNLFKEGVAVAIDDEIIKKANFEKVTLKDGMHVDIFNLVSGG